MQPKVFISSRLEELEEERKAIEEAVSELRNHERLPFTIWSWEHAKEIPSGKHPDTVQSEGVHDSDIYILILGVEYGDFKYGESPTHKEYKIACRDVEEDCILIFIKEAEKREEKLEEWIAEIKDKDKHTSKPFKNPDQLKNFVKTRLRDLWNKRNQKTDIPTIQTVLRKGETREGDFFKKEPEWIDFEEGFIVERKEVGEVIKKLENDNIQLVWGESASGKSVILKNIGFELANENKDVYVLELKKHSRDEVKCYFDEILMSNDEKAVFIIDDTHLQFAECERLIREFKNRELKAKLIVGSRPIKEIHGEHPKEALEFEYLSKTSIRAGDVAETIIRRTLRREDYFSDERIKTVSEKLEGYKKDLWHLSWALKAYNPEKESVEEGDVYEKIRDSIRRIKLGKDESGEDKFLNAEDIFLPLSIFYRFEIPIERKFLEDQLEIKENKINQLIELSEIIETEEIGRNRMLSLIHSSVAELYFKTYQAYPALGDKNKDKIIDKCNEDLQYCLFYKYITSTDTSNASDIFVHFGILLGGIFVVTLIDKLLGDGKVGKAISDIGKVDEVVILLNKLVEDKKVEKAIKDGIEKEDIVHKFFDTLFGKKVENAIK
ncbi:hypothetical protein C5S30_04380 [ANME-1 cluster archaeon GoMg4]|nr:hypothetical protein [ANME-1 cluster archaeon GoMg4]